MMKKGLKNGIYWGLVITMAGALCVLAVFMTLSFAGEATTKSIQDIFPPEPEIELPPPLQPLQPEPETCYEELTKLQNSLWYTAYYLPPVWQAQYLYFTNIIIPISGNKYWGDYWLLIGIDSGGNITGTVYRGESFEGVYLTVDASHNIGSYSYNVDSYNVESDGMAGVFAYDRSFAESYEFTGDRIF